MWKLRSQTSFDQSWSAEQKVSARKYVTAPGGQIRAKKVCFALYWCALCFVLTCATQCKNRTNQSKRCVMVDINARKRDLWRSPGIRRAPHWGTQWYILYKQLLLVHLNKHTNIDDDNKSGHIMTNCLQQFLNELMRPHLRKCLNLHVKKVGRPTVSMPLCLNCKKMLKDADFARGWMKSCQNQIWLKSTLLDRWWRQCSVICSEKSDRRELITREMIYSRIFIPCHSHQICAINELCGDRSIAKNLPKILTNSRLCLLQCCL